MVRARSAIRDPAARRRAGPGRSRSPKARPSPPFLPGVGAGSRAGRPLLLQADKGGGGRVPACTSDQGAKRPGPAGV